MLPLPVAFLSPLLNCFVHVLMYAYYGLSVFPSLRKYLWWKNYLTIIQMVKQVDIMYLSVFVSIIGSSCSSFG